MACARRDDWAQPGLRTSPMPRRYCSTSIWLARGMGPGTVIWISPRYWRPLAGRAVTERPAGTAQRGRGDAAGGGAGTGGAVDGGGAWGGGGGGGGLVVVVVSGGRVGGGPVVEVLEGVVMVGPVVVGVKGAWARGPARETMTPPGRATAAAFTAAPPPAWAW